MNITATLIGQILTFAVLVWFVKAVLWEPMLKVLDDRKKRIADGLEAAERGQHEKELADKRAKEKLLEAKKKAADILGQAQKRAGEIIEEAKGTAIDEGNRIKTSAQTEIDREVQRAKEALRKQVAGIALAGAGQILEREIDPAAHRAVLDQLANQI